MIEYGYFPGCTLSTKAKNLDRSARKCSEILGIGLVEIPGWTCCGAAFPLATDSAMGMLPPSRLLAKAGETHAELTTLCSCCYNVLKRTSYMLANDKEKREKIHAFIEKEHRADLKVLHYMEILRDDLGFEKVASMVTRPLTGLKAAAYYGCMLLRPAEELGLDDPERPTIFENFLRTLGAEAVEFPYRTECCGAFQTVASPDVSRECSRKVLESAMAAGAEAIVSTCPLCTYNVDHRQADIAAARPGFAGIPVFYFTQLLGIALGLGIDELGFEGNAVDPAPLLASKGLL
jgi:heterodisulfide reductase subunit B